MLRNHILIIHRYNADERDGKSFFFALVLSEFKFSIKKILLKFSHAAHTLYRFISLPIHIHNYFSLFIRHHSHDYIDDDGKKEEWKERKNFYIYYNGLLLNSMNIVSYVMMWENKRQQEKL